MESPSAAGLRSAIINFNIDKVQELLERGADANAYYPDSDTPLLIAARANHVSISCMLVDEGASVNVQDARGMTPLMYAATFGSSQLVLNAMRSGAQQSLKNNKGQMAFDCAMENGQYQVAQLLAQNDEHRRLISEAQEQRHTATQQQGLRDRVADRQQALRNLARKNGFRL